ncbi:MAG: DUF4258 domain-containing protein [Firmicutes bacterium]|nr:DUF4258 domain-containing protein [Bacillota bacterium]
MEVRYTVHARQRMAERGVSEAEVEAAIGDSDITYPDGPGRTNFIRGRLRVVAATDGKVVITVVRL